MIQLLWYFLPAYVANMTPVFARVIPFLDIPVDFGKKVGGVRLFGNHKTWRGLVFGTLMGGATFCLQAQYRIPGWEIFDYPSMSLWFGFALGFGALFGDLVKSFLKRRMGIKPGKPWYFVDQVDYVLGGILFGSYFYALQINQMLMLIVLSVVLTIIANHLGQWLKIRKVSW